MTDSSVKTNFGWTILKRLILMFTLQKFRWVGMAVQVAQNSFEHQINSCEVSAEEVGPGCWSFFHPKLLRQVQRQRGKRTQSNFDKEFHIGHKQIMMHLQYLIHVDSTQIPLASSSHHRAGVIWSEGRSQGDTCPYILCLDSHVTFNSSFTVFSLFPLKTQPVARQVHGQASCKTKPKCRWTWYCIDMDRGKAPTLKQITTWNCITQCQQNFATYFARVAAKMV